MLHCKIGSFGEICSKTRLFFDRHSPFSYRVLLDVYFSRMFYRSLLNKPYRLEDVQSIDEALYKNLKWILDNQIDDMYLGLCFQADREVLGGYTVTKELKEGGADIEVTDENKHEYVDLLIKWRTDFGTREAIWWGYGEIFDSVIV